LSAFLWAQGLPDAPMPQPAPPAHPYAESRFTLKPLVTSQFAPRFAPLFMPQLSPSPVFRPGFNPIFVLSHSRYRLPRTMGKLWKLEDKYYVPQAAPAMPGIPRMPRRKR